MNNTKKNTEALFVSCKAIGLELNAEKTEQAYTFKIREHNTRNY
jgi:hypothetical protein